MRAGSNTYGTEGLLLAFQQVPGGGDDALWFRRAEVFSLIDGEGGRQLADPRGGDALVRFIETHPHVHWQTRAAFALAQIGDLRAVTTLAKRMYLDPRKVYSDETDYERTLKRDDQDRVTAARYLAELADLHPEDHAWIRALSEDAVIFWLRDYPSPHANGMRALAAMGSTKAIPALREWAFPPTPLPQPGQELPMPEEWVVAQSASRYLGRLRDSLSFDALVAALRRRPRELDVTMDYLMSGDVALLGMSLRAIGVGAADGLSEWGDPRAFAPLVAFVEDTRNNEQARDAACAAIPWVAAPADEQRILAAVKRHTSPTKEAGFIRHCLVRGAARRALSQAVATDLFFEALERDGGGDVSAAAAGGIGRSGLSAGARTRLEPRVARADGIPHAIALMLGGTPEVAAWATREQVEASKARGSSAEKGMQRVFLGAIEFLSVEDLENGALFRWVRNAEAIAELEVGGQRQDWALTLLGSRLREVEYDTGPHSITRPGLRCRLLKLATEGRPEQRQDAVRTLQLMGEFGPLLALRDRTDELGRLAQRALSEVLEYPELNTDE